MVESFTTFFLNQNFKTHKMKIENIGIRNPADIGVSDIDVYGTDNKKYEAFERTEKVKLRIGVFFDGTGNNKFNSDSVYYNKRYNSKLPLKENEIKKIEGFKSFVIESGSSYWNSYSNIALLHDLYEEKTDRKNSPDVKFQSLQLKFYIQGIGTLKNEKDDSITGYIGNGLGEGPRGVIARVEQACQDIADTIDEALKKNQDSKPLEIISIQFDVFGFSRGAAAARHFCNEVLKSGRDKNPGNGGERKITNLKRPAIKKYVNAKDQTPKIKRYETSSYKKEKDNIKVVQQFNAPARDVFIGGRLGELLSNKGINYPKYNVSIEFLGLFDTVISQMLERKGIIDLARNPITRTLSAILSPVMGLLTNAVAVIPKVNTSLSNPNIRKILHIKAQTEWRDNFPLTPVGNIADTTYAKEITVLGAHSDVGGAYWQSEEELHTLHFFDLGKDATEIEKQKLEQKKKELRNWYISQRLCADDETNFYWETKHHVKVIVQSPYTSAMPGEFLLMDEDFMDDQTSKTEGNRTYILQGYHYRLRSKRPLDNKLSLVYMNVMKHIALNYAGVPLLLPEDKAPHPEEYIYPKDYDIADNEIYELESDDTSNPKNQKKTDLEKYQNLMIKIAKHGWTNKNGKVVTYPKLIDENNFYDISPDMYDYIMGKFVHLSANFDTPLVNLLDHYNLVYANVPHFTDEKSYKNPPYKREAYAPVLPSAGQS